jgi:hypothetical protein
MLRLGDGELPGCHAILLLWLLLLEAVGGGTIVVGSWLCVQQLLGPGGAGRLNGGQALRHACIDVGLAWPRRLW